MRRLPRRRGSGRRCSGLDSFGLNRALVLIWQALAAILFESLWGVLMWRAGTRPGGRLPFLARARKGSKRSTPYCLRPLRCATGQPASQCLRGAPWNSLRACGAPFKHPRQARQRSMGAPTPMHTPQALRPRRIQKGGGTARAIAALGPNAQALRAAKARPSAAMARIVPHPCGCACGGAVAGWHGRRSAHASLSSSPWLFERSAQRGVSSTAHPATAPPQVCPVAKRRGRRLGACFFCFLFLHEQEKEVARRGESRPATSKHPTTTQKE
jgi:hypothetical protein